MDGDFQNQARPEHRINAGIGVGNCESFYSLSASSSSGGRHTTRPIPALALAALLLLMAAGASHGASEDSREVVLADDILAAIERGDPVDYDGVIVVGDLDIGALDLKTYDNVVYKYGKLKGLDDIAKVVESAINITNSDILGTVYFNNARFNKTVVFEKNSFQQDVYFVGSRFMADSKFKGAKFGGISRFGCACFEGEADFQEAQFNNSAYFWNCTFEKMANFFNAEFNDVSFGDYVEQPNEEYIPGFWMGPVGYEYPSGWHMLSTLGDTIFYKEAFFTNVQFKGTTEFTNAKFYSICYFDLAYFDKDVNFMGTRFGESGFDDAHFNGNVDFSGSQFHGWTHFENAQFNKIAKFYNASFIQTANFRNAYFSDNRNFITDFEKARFYKNVTFVETKFSQIAYFENASFYDYLDLTGSRIDQFVITWNLIKNQLICDDAVYLSLTKSFETLGQFDDADDCYYKYRLESQKHKPIGISKISDWISRLSYGYGVRPENTIFSSFVIIGLFGIILWRGGGIQRSTYPCQSKSQNISVADALYFSTLTFVSQPPYNWGPREGSRWKYMVMVENILGWIFLTLFVIALT